VQGNAIYSAIEAGVRVEAGASNNVIGGTAAGAANEIVNCREAGVLISGFGLTGAPTEGNVVQGNTFITNGNIPSAGSPSPPDPCGAIVVVGAHNTLIGGTSVAARNLISANAPAGIQLARSYDSTIQGNYIGPRADGMAAFSNAGTMQYYGIQVLDCEATVIGGTQPGAGNLISGNQTCGIAILRTAAFYAAESVNLIQGNRIGTNATGTGPILFGNENRGIGTGIIVSSGSSNGQSVATYIGSSTLAAGNVISGNSTAVEVKNSNGIQLSHNYIGTNAAGTGPVENYRGIVITSSQNVAVGLSSIAGALPGGPNRIAFNSNAGILVSTDSNANQFRGNSIWANGGVGIALIGSSAFAGSPNDSLDTDTGGNGLQNHPVINTATIASGKALVSGMLNSTPQSTFTLDFYGNPAAEPSVRNEGQVYLGSTTIATDANGDAPFSIAVTPSALSRFVTATATSTEGTSEFGNAVELPATVEFGAANYTVDENGGTATVTVSRTGPTTSAFTVGYTMANGTAVSGSDYVLASGTLAFAAGETEKTFTVTILTDSNDEPNETVRLILRSPSPGATVGGVLNQATLKIIDDDASPTLSINNPTFVEGSFDSITYGNFTVTLTGATAQPVTVRYATYNGTAQHPGDYMFATGTLIFSPGETSKTIAVRLFYDSVFELDETFRVDLLGPINATLARGSGIGTILADSETNGEPEIWTRNSTVTEGRPGSTTTITFPLTLTHISRKQILLRFYLTDGTARRPSDYANATATIVFNPGESQKFVTVTVNGDAEIEANETFTVVLIGAVNATIANSIAVGTIVNDDFPTISVGDAAGAESSTGMVNFPVTLSAPIPFPVRVGYATLNNTAVATSDFVSTVGTLEFLPGETSKIVSVPVANDSTFEATENFRLVLSRPVSATLTRAIGIGIIADDDAAPTLSIGDAEATEGSGPGATVTVTLSAASGQQVIVRYVTSNGTARQPDDYTYATGTLVFAPGETSKTINVAVQDDALAESSETFGINLIGPVNATLARAQGIVTIMDNDSVQ